MYHTFFKPDFSEREPRTSNLELLRGYSNTVGYAGPGHYLKTNPNPIPCCRWDPQTWPRGFFLDERKITV